MHAEHTTLNVSQFTFTPNFWLLYIHNLTTWGPVVCVFENSGPDLVEKPTQEDWNELKYLKGTANLSLIIENDNHQEKLIGYADAD